MATGAQQHFTSIGDFRRRAVLRMAHGILEPGEYDDEDVLGLLRGRVFAERLIRLQRFDRGKRVHECRPMFGVPFMALLPRPTNSAGYRTFHCRDDVTERSAAGHDNYATDAEKKAAVEKAAVHAEQREADAAPPTAADHDRYSMSEKELVSMELPDAQFRTTMHRDLSRRQKDWDIIASGERKAGFDRINIHYDLAPEFLDAIAADAECPVGLREILIKEHERCAAGTKLPKRKAKHGQPWIDSEARVGHRWLKRKAKEAGLDAGLFGKFSPGREGRTHRRGVIELPARFDEQAQSAVMDGLAAFLQDQAADFPGFTVALFLVRHVPDGWNDWRNHHLHFIYHDRPFRYDEEGNIELADRKVPSMTRLGWIETFRAKCADLINTELERIGADYRVSEKSLVELGIQDASGQEHLDARAALFEAGAVPTQAGLRNVAESWRRTEMARAANLAERLTKIEEDDRALGERIDDTLTSQEAVISHSKRVAARMQAEAAARLAAEAEEITSLIDMATSRARHARKKAGHLGSKDRQTPAAAYEADGWQRRRDDADAYLSAIDRELDIERSAVGRRKAAAEEAQAKAEAHLALIEEALCKGVRPAPARDLAGETTLNVPTMAAEPHRLLDRLIRAPIRIIEQQGQYAFETVADSDTHDFSAAPFQSRMKAAKQAQDKEIRALSDYLVKHAASGSRPGDMTSSPPYLQRQMERWGVSSEIQALLRSLAGDNTEDASISEKPACLDDTPDAGPSPARSGGSSAAKPSLVIPAPARTLKGQGLGQGGPASALDLEATVKAAARHLAERREEKSRLTEARIERAIHEHAFGTPRRPGVTDAYREFLYRVGREPHLMSRHHDRIVIAKHADQRFRDQFNTFMRLPAAERDVRQTWKPAWSGRPTWPNAHRDAMVLMDEHAGVRSDIIERARQRDFSRAGEFAQRLESIMASGRPLTIRHGLVGVHDPLVLGMAGGDIISMLTQSTQDNLTVAMLLQQAEREEVTRHLSRSSSDLVMALDEGRGQVLVDLKPGAPRHVKEVFDRWSGSTQFLADCVDAAHADGPGDSKPVHRNPRMRAWLRSASCNGTVRQALARELLRDPNAKRLLAEDVREASRIEKAASASNEFREKPGRQRRSGRGRAVVAGAPSTVR